jgi:hypothetical protein
MTTLTEIARSEGRLTFVAGPPPAQVAFAADSDEALSFLAPVIGPSSTLLLFHVSRILRDALAVHYDLHELSQTIGLGRPERLACNSKILHTVGRLELFGYLRLSTTQPDVVEVLTQIPPLPRRYLRSLPVALHAAAPTV